MEIREFHWLMNIVQNLDIGLVVLDHNAHIEIWNGFMESHSGRFSHDVKGGNLFALFPEIDHAWLQRKLAQVITLNSRSFITWEQRQYVFRFSNYRPITGSASCMYQNITLIPLPDFAGKVTHVAMLIYDVTDEAVYIKQQAIADV